MARTKASARRGLPVSASLNGVNKRGTAVQKHALSTKLKAGAAGAPKKSTAKKAKQTTTEVFGDYVLKTATEEDSYSAESDDDSYDGGEEFTMSVFPDGKQVWANFELESVEGCMKFGKCHVSKGQKTYDFKWRGRETGEGQIECGSENKGSIKFCGDRLEGTIGTPFGTVKVTGKRVLAEPSNASPDVWEYCTEEQYEEERVARWR